MPPSTLIVGAGISGLAVAHFLRRRLGPDAPITVIDSAARVGGKINTVSLEGLPVDTGPDAFLARAGELRSLIDDLGLEHEIIEPLAGGSYIWSRGRLRPIPPGAAFGLPDKLWPLLRSGLLSPGGVARAGMDILLPASNTQGDPSVADLVRPRFGSEVYHRLVEPLLGGVHAGDPARLSAKSTVPEITAMAADGRSLYLSMRSRRSAAPEPTGKRTAPLVSIRGGLHRLVQALANDLGDDNLITGAAIRTLERTTSGWRASSDAGEFMTENLVLSVPAYVAADLLGPVSADLSDQLGGIPYVDVANATLAFHVRDIPDLPPGTGFLVPPVEGRFVVGCTWLTSKWPHLVNDDVVLIKCMVGRSGDTRWLSMSDEQIIDGIRGDLAGMLGIRSRPFNALLQRWPRAIPQYVVGHAARLDRIDEHLRAIGDLYLSGAAYRGSGLAGCATQSAGTAERIAKGVHR
ncbi:MAG: protoporphyrinogen oxidase [Candidatus Nanopelagicales bacterium]